MDPENLCGVAGLTRLARAQEAGDDGDWNHGKGVNGRARAARPGIGDGAGGEPGVAEEVGRVEWWSGGLPHVPATRLLLLPRRDAPMT